MSSSLAESTLAQYNVTYRLWWNFCARRHLFPFDGNISDIISFFQDLLKSTNNVYGSFNSHRAALSLILPGSVGENAYLKRYMKGVFRLRPPQPRYNLTWDPQQVLSFLRGLSDLDLKVVSTKLVTLLILATGQRIQTISLIKCSNILELESGVTIFISDLMKTSGPKREQPCLKLPYFTEEPRLCVASLIKKYLEMTQEFRQPNCDKFLLTYKKPHRPASKQTLSRWVRDILGASGIDTSIFKAHSTRHAVTSAALRKGVSVQAIKKTAGWTESSKTFAKFYNRPLCGPDNFLESIFSSDT